MKKPSWQFIAIGVILLLTVVAICIAVFSQPEQPLKIGICYKDPVGTQYRQALEQGLRARGYTLVVEDADLDQAKQLEKIAALATAECDLLIVEPVMVTAVQELTQCLNDTGLPVLMIGKQPDQQLLESVERICYVSYDRSQIGTLQGEMAYSSLTGKWDINGDGTVSYAVIQGPEDHLDAQTITAGCISFMEEHTSQLLVTQYGDWSFDSGKQLCDRLLAEFGRDVEVIFCNSDQMALGAAQAITDRGWQVGESVFLFGAGGEAAALKAVDSGAITGTVNFNTLQQAAKALEVIGLILEGKQVEKQYLIDCTPYIGQ